MLAKLFRFHGHESVRRAYRQGRPVRNQLGSLHVAKSNRIGVAHVAVVVSRKVDKSAVTRNRIRRRIYEIIGLSGITEMTGIDIVLTVQRAEAAVWPSEELKKAIEDLLHKAKLSR